MKFEIINDQLCRMVEPTPLTPESKFPCVVRLIQDDSPMGRYHKDLFRMDKDEYNPKICNEVRSLSDLSDSNRGSVIHSGGIISAQYYHFEIIGYPVVEGSAEWALYQLGNDKSVQLPNRVVLRPSDFYSPKEAWEVVMSSPTGWQLYEPKPLPMASTHDGLGDKFLRDCLKPNEHPIITGCNKLDYVPVEGIRIPKEPKPEPPKEPDYVICKRCGGTGYEIKEPERATAKLVRELLDRQEEEK